MTTHPVNNLDDLTHQRIRLGVLAMLSKVQKLEFTRIRDDLGTTDGNLSRHLNALNKNKLVTINKSATPPAKTWIELTAEGQTALRKEVVALRSMLDHVEIDIEEP